MAEKKEVGKITHYYGKIGVGIVELSDGLRVGDTIHIKGHTSDFTQTVESIQVEHQNVSEAKAKDVVGMKVIDKVHPGDIVYKVIS